MSGIDILAVIDRAAGGLFAAQGVMPGDLMQARTAVEKLIADRAELLEALQRLATHRPRTSEQIDADWDAARAAIARATGEGNEPTL